MRKENDKSTPVETPKAEFRNHVNQSTEEKDHNSYGIIAIVVIIAIILIGFLLFYGIGA